MIVPGDPHAGARRVPATAALACVLALAAVLLLLAGAPLYTDDLWWHLAAGEMYAREGPWPASDALLHTAGDGGPVQHEWLFGLAVHGLREAIGYQGLRAAHALAVVAITWLAWTVLARGGWRVASCLALGLLVVLSWPRLVQLRPDLVSIPAALLTYRLLLEPEQAPSWPRTAAFGALVALWANMHSLFLVGINLLIAAVLGIVLAAILRRLAEVPPAWPPGARRRALRLLAACVIGVLAAGFNPRGFGQHLTFLESSGAAAIWLITDEWSPFHPFDPGANHETVTTMMWLAADLVMAAFAVVALLALRAAVRERTAPAIERFDAVHFGLGLAGIVALLVSVRFLWMAVFPMLYVLGAAGRWRARAGPRGRAADWLGVAPCLALAAAFATGYGPTTLVTRFAAEPLAYLRMPYRTHKYHLEGVHFLQASGVEGNLYNPYWMGGFLGHWLAPRLRTFIDGRTEHYPVEVYEDHSAVQLMGSPRAGETFVDVLERRGVDLYFGVGFPGWWQGVYTTTALDRVPGWLLVSRSYRHAIYLRDTPRNAANLARIVRWYAAEGVPFDPGRGLEPGRVVRERPGWAMRHGLLPPDHPALLDAVRGTDPARRARALRVLAVVHLLDGAYREQAEFDRALLALAPDDDRARLRLAFALLALDRGDEAIAQLEQLPAGRPPDPAARRLVAAAREIQRVRESLVAGDRGIREQVFINLRLRAAVPVGSAETWPLEHVIETEKLDLHHPRQ